MEAANGCATRDSGRWILRGRPTCIAALAAFILVLALSVGARAASAAVLSGTVDGEGQSPAGLAEAQITVTEPGSGIPVAVAATALDGTYSVVVPEGTYDVSVAPPFGGRFSPATETNELVGAEAVLNVTLASSEQSSSVSGVLRGENGLPIPAALLQMHATGINVQARTAANGAFTLSAPAGTYELTVIGKEAGPTHDEFRVYLSIKISGATRENLTLPANTLTVEVVGPHGEPVKGAYVSVGTTTTVDLAPGIGGDGDFSSSSRTGSAGTVAVSYFDASGLQEVEVYPGSTALAAPSPIRFAPTSSDHIQRVVLSSPATLTGTLLGYGGTPLPGVRISASGPSYTLATTAADGSFELPLTPGIQSLDIYGERAKGASAIAAPRSFSFTTTPTDLTESANVVLTLPLHALSVTAEGSGAPIEELPIAATGSGNVAAGQMLAPGIEVASATVSDRADTNARGTASLSFPDFAEQSYANVAVEAGAWKEDRIPAVGISQDSSRTLSLTAASTGGGYTFSGRMQTSDGTPVPAFLTLEKGVGGKPGFVERSAATNVSGRFSIEVPEAGSYRLNMEPLFETPGVPSDLSMYGASVEITGNREEELTVPVSAVQKTFMDGPEPVASASFNTWRGNCYATAPPGPGIGAGSWAFEMSGRSVGTSGRMDLLGVANGVCEGEFDATDARGSELYGELREQFGAGDQAQEEQLGGPEVSGTVRDASGEPLPDASFTFGHAVPGGYIDSETDADSAGRYSTYMPEGTSDVEISDGSPFEPAGAPESFSFEGQLSVTGAMTQDVTLPTHAVTVHVVSDAGSPQADVGVSEEDARGTLASTAAEPPGLTLTTLWNFSSSAVTDESGNATLALPDITEPQLLWLTPSESMEIRPVQLELNNVTSNETELVALGPSDHETPVVSGVSVTGASEAVTQIAISGTHLLEASAVRCGDEQASVMTVQSASVVLADCPRSTGTVDVTVTTPAGTSALAPSDRFTYPTVPPPPAVRCGSPDNSWHSENQTVACTATDTLPGLAHPEEASFSLATTVAAGTETAEAFTGSRTVCDTEGRCVEAGPVGPLKIDRKPPSIKISRPASGLLVLQGSSGSVAFACADSGSGIAGCEGSTPDGQPLETTTLGEHTLAVRASDNSGNESSQTVHYTVVAGGECESALCQVGAGDTTPPTVLSLSANRSSVDTSTGPQPVTLSVHAADDFSGVAALQLSLTGSGRAYTGLAKLEAGTRLNGTWSATLTLPQGSPQGTYAIGAAVVDEAGNSRSYNYSELAILGLGSILQKGPGTPPQPPPLVTAVAASPSSVATCPQAESVTVTVAASDAPAGISTLHVQLTGPASQQVSGYATLQEGTAQSGTWSAVLTLPAYSAQGEWGLTVQARDGAGNETYLTPSELELRGYADVVHQTCAGDSTPPQVTALTVAPSTVDTGAGAKVVAVEAHATDDLSGVASVAATLSSGSQAVTAPARLQPGGSSLSGNWVADLTLPQYSRQGTWQLSLRAADSIGNATTLSSVRLAEMGLPSSISQTGIADETPPAVTGGTVVPTRVDTENGPEQVQVRIQATDALSGTARLWVGFTSLHGQHVVGWATLEEGGTPQEGTWRADLTFPRYADEGGWEMRVEAWDAFGNHIAYGPSELDTIVPTLHDGPPVPPAVTAVGPIYGREEGGTSVTVEGSNLEEIAAVKFGTANARSFVQTSPHSLTAIAPQGAGTVDVRVVTEGGKSPAATVDRFTYIPPMPPPAIKKLSANKGPAAGGTTVTITGEDFEGVTGVSFGSAAAASFSVTSPTSITAVAPPNVSEEVSVSVTTPNGTSAATSKTNFKTEGPTVTSVAPATGPKAGNSRVTIRGTGFAPGTRTIILFGKTAAKEVACSSTTACEATTPVAVKAGLVDVIAEIGKTKSKKSAADHFTYD